MSSAAKAILSRPLCTFVWFKMQVARESLGHLNSHSFRSSSIQQSSSTEYSSSCVYAFGSIRALWTSRCEEHCKFHSNLPPIIFKLKFWWWWLPEEPSSRPMVTTATSICRNSLDRIRTVLNCRLFLTQPWLILGEVRSQLCVWLDAGFARFVR